VLVSGDPIRPDPRLNQELGIIGRLFGYNENARLNLVGLMILFCIGMIVWSTYMLFTSTVSEVRTAAHFIITTFVAVMSGLVGFITGRKSK
jgi:hypothetical protein